MGHLPYRAPGRDSPGARGGPSHRLPRCAAGHRPGDHRARAAWCSTSRASSLGRAYREFEQHFPRPGWVEHDAERDLGRHAGSGRARRSRTPGCAPASSRRSGSPTSARPSCVWDPATGEPLHRAIVWQDRRTRRALRRAARGRAARRSSASATGLVLDPYFSGDEDRVAAAQRRRAAPSRRATGGRCSGRSTRGWSGKLTGECTSPTRRNASRTLLLRHRERRWDAELLRRCSACPSARCPRSCRRCGEFGRRSADALHGHGGARSRASPATSRRRSSARRCLEPGLGKNTYGTGSFVLLNAGDRRAGTPATGCWPRSRGSIGQSRTYALEAAIFVTGAAVQWLRDGLGIIEAAARDRGAGGVAGLQRRRLLRARADRARLAALGPVRARHDRRAHARQRPGAPRARRARGDGLPDGRRGAGDGGGAGTEPLAELRADGGATANEWLMQFQADVLGVPVVVPEVAETTALGAAMLAGVGAGLWTQLDGVARDGHERGPLRAADGRGRARVAARAAGAGRSSAPAAGPRMDADRPGTRSGPSGDG